MRVMKPIAPANITWEIIVVLPHRRRQFEFTLKGHAEWHKRARCKRTCAHRRDGETGISRAKA